MISIIKRQGREALSDKCNKWSVFEPRFRWIKFVHSIHPSPILNEGLTRRYLRCQASCEKQTQSLLLSSQCNHTVKRCNKLKTIMLKPLQSLKLPLFCSATLPRQCFSLILSFLKAAQFLPFEGYGLQFVSYYYCLWLIKFWSVSQPRQLRAVIITCHMV